MPTRKQRRRAQKGRRHEYETVWVDGEGNELEEPPEELVAAPARTDGAKPKSKATREQRGGRPVRVPPPPPVPERRSSGSKWKSAPASASTDSPAASTRTAPSSTSRSADSFTPWSPSDSPARNEMRTALSAPSLECRTTGDRVPCGISTSPSLQWRTDEPFPHSPGG